MDTTAHADATESPATRDTEPAPSLETRPSFALSEATLWVVTATCLPTAEGAERALVVRNVMTSDPSGGELFGVVTEPLRRDLPGCRDVVLSRIERCGDVRGTVVRSKPTS